MKTFPASPWLANLALVTAATSAALLVAMGCQNSSSNTPAGPSPSASTNTPAAEGGSEAGTIDPASITAEMWLGFMELGFEDTPDPSNTDLYASARGLAVNKPQTPAETAAHKAEFDTFMQKRINVPKGQCVPRRTYPLTSDKPRFADVGDAKITKDAADFLLLTRLSEGNLKDAQSTVSSSGVGGVYGLSLKYWVSDLGLSEFSFGNMSALSYTSTPAAGTDGTTTLSPGIALLLQFNQSRDKAVSHVTLSTANPTGPYYECYGDDTGKVTVPADILGEFNTAVGTNEFYMEVEHFYAGFWGVNSVSGPLPLEKGENFLGFVTYLGTASRLHF